MTSSKSDVVDAVLNCFERAEKNVSPYDHWIFADCIPKDTLDDIINLPLEAPNLEGVSGTRELHNATRTYFDAETQANNPSCAAFAEAFQDKRVTDKVCTLFGADLDNTNLRIEYAQDIGEFWLEPHTDIGVKNFTMLIYLSKDAGQEDLGTDIYDNDRKFAGRMPFHSNGGMVFVPANNTWHGFTRRKINSVRKSIIVNYVTHEWRERGQLAFDEPVS